MENTQSKVRIVVQGETPWQYKMRFWGLSALVGSTILFDTFSRFWPVGLGMLRLGSSFRPINTIVLSHDHWDHNGGMEGVLRRTQNPRVFLPPHTSPVLIAKVKARGGQICPAGFQEIEKDVFLLNPLPADLPKGRVWEHALALRGEDGVTLLTGCSHPGIAAMVREAQTQMGAPVTRIIGGLHLMNDGPDKAKALAGELKDLGVRTVEACHCTGAPAKQILKANFS